jgi:hypothetical protein
VRRTLFVLTPRALLPAPRSESPVVSTGFTLNGNVAAACPILNSGSSAETLAVGYVPIAISFSPVAAGTVSGSVTITDNSLSAAAPGYETQSILLSGTGN